jgi:phenylalanyl-tRNA synthetase alpha subunit
MWHTLFNKYNKIVVSDKIYNLLSVDITQKDEFHQNDFLVIRRHYHTHH